MGSVLLGWDFGVLRYDDYGNGFGWCLLLCVSLTSTIVVVVVIAIGVLIGL